MKRHLIALALLMATIQPACATPTDYEIRICGAAVANRVDQIRSKIRAFATSDISSDPKLAEGIAEAYELAGSLFDHCADRGNAQMQFKAHFLGAPEHVSALSAAKQSHNPALLRRIQARYDAGNRWMEAHTP